MEIGKNRRVLILTSAVQSERTAVREFLTNVRVVKTDEGTITEQGTYRDTSGEWEVTLAQVGPTNLLTAGKMGSIISVFQPDVVLFVGVGGGLNKPTKPTEEAALRHPVRPEIDLGDVLFPDKVYYSEGGVGDEQFKPRPIVFFSGYRLLEQAKLDSTRDEWQKSIPKFAARKLAPRLIIKPIASSEQVVKSLKSDAVKVVALNYSDARAFDMESAGVFAGMLPFPHIPCGVVRGISDTLENKDHAGNDDFQTEVAENAAAYAFWLLSHIDLPQLGPLSAEPSVRPNAPVRDLSGPHRLLLFTGPRSNDISTAEFWTEYEVLRKRLEGKRTIELLLPALSGERSELMDRLLGNEQPTLIHFSGHGIENGLVVIQPTKQVDVLSAEDAQAIIGQIQLTGVVLNACKSANVAEAICKRVLFAVGYKGALLGDVAVRFTEMFYSRLDGGDTVKSAFDAAFQACGGSSLHEDTKPQLFAKTGFDPALARFVRGKPVVPRHRELSEVITDLPALLMISQMFFQDTERSGILAKIGITQPGRLVRPREEEPQFIDRLTQYLGDKKLLNETVALLSLLPKNNVRPENFPQLARMQDECAQLLQERQVIALRSTFPAADG